MDDDDKPQQQENEDEDDYWERIQEWEESVRKVVVPDAEEFGFPAVPEYRKKDLIPGTKDKLQPELRVDLKRDCLKRGLQVIAKLANIELTPEKPEYLGGAWHVEGQLVG